MGIHIPVKISKRSVTDMLDQLRVCNIHLDSNEEMNEVLDYIKQGFRMAVEEIDVTDRNWSRFTEDLVKVFGKLRTAISLYNGLCIPTDENVGLHIFSNIDMISRDFDDISQICANVLSRTNPVHSPEAESYIIASALSQILKGLTVFNERCNEHIVKKIFIRPWGTLQIVSVKPQLIILGPENSVGEALKFYKNAFSAEVLIRNLRRKRKADQELPSVVSAELKLGSLIFVVSGLPDGTTTLDNKSGCTFRLWTKDVDGLFHAAARDGAVIDRELNVDAVYGRCGSPAGKVTDPYGNIWFIFKGKGEVLVQPQLVIQDSRAKEAVNFFRAAFGASHLKRDIIPKRKAGQQLPSVVIAELKLASLVFVVCDLVHETATLAGTGCTFRLETRDIRGIINLAVSAGAVFDGKLTESADKGCHGGPTGKLTDPYGNVWLICSV